jgi:hypothetical protein
VKDLTTIIADAILDGMQASDPEASWHEPGRQKGSVYIEGSFIMADVAKHVANHMADAMKQEAKRFEGAMSGDSHMAIYRDMARILQVR